MSTTWSSFVSLYGEEPLPAWNHALRDLTDQQIMAGYERAVKAGLEFPPNLSVFLEYCSTDPDWEHRRLKLCHDVLSAPIVDKGADQFLIEDHRDVPAFGDFKALMRG